MGFLSGLFGGGEKQKAPEVEPIQPVPQAELQTTGWGGMGYTPVPQTFTAEGKPDWMTGWFDAPWWGKDAATGGQLTNADMMVQPQAPPQAPPQQAPQEDPLNWGQPSMASRMPLIGMTGGMEWGDPYAGWD